MAWIDSRQVPSGMGKQALLLLLSADDDGEEEIWPERL
jgi:hypothetical protein